MSKDTFKPIQDVQAESLRGLSLRGGGIALGNQAIKFALQVISTAILARLLSPGDYGLVAMVTSVLGFTNMLKDLGLSTVTVQKKAITQGELSALFWISVLLGLILALLLGLCAPLIVMFYHRKELLWLTWAYAGIAVVSSLGTQHSALLQRQMRFGSLAARDLIATVLGMIAGIAGATAGMGYWALVVLQGTNALAGTIFLWWKSEWRPELPRRVSGLGGSIRFGGSVTISNLIAYVNHNLDVILLGRQYGDVVVGLYSRAQGLLNKPLQQILPPIMSVATPMFSRLASDHERFKEAALLLVRVACFGGCLIVMSVLPTADWIVSLMLGEKWIGTVAIFRLLAPFGLLEPLAYLLGTMLVAYGRPGSMARWWAVSMVVIAISFFMGLRWGAIGVAAAYAISGIATRIWLVFFVGKHIGIPGQELLGACGPFVLLAGGISGGLFLLRSVWKPMGTLVPFLLYLSLGVIVFVGGILCLPSGRRFLREIRKLTADLLKGFRTQPQESGD